MWLACSPDSHFLTRSKQFYAGTTRSTREKLPPTRARAREVGKPTGQDRTTHPRMAAKFGEDIPVVACYPARAVSFDLSAGGIVVPLDVTGSFCQAIFRDYVGRLC